MQLTLKANLLFTKVTVSHQDRQTHINNILIDTGSASTLLSTEHMESIGVIPSPYDSLHRIHGIGGTETVFTRCIDYLQVGECKLTHFEIEIGGMDYGFDINGILGMDFLIRTGAVINLQNLTMAFKSDIDRIN